MKIVTVVGARPQFVKAAVISRELQEHAQRDVEEIIIHTGQHFDADMSDIFFSEMQIPKPRYSLGIGGQSHGAMTGKMIEQIEIILLKEKPDCVLVYGDTNSTLAGATAAVKIHIPIAHVEAGLRSFNRRMPEEINRVLTDHISTWLFAPTDTAVNNLLAEGVNSNSIHKTGDVMCDASMFYARLAMKNSTILDKLYLKPNEFILATIHRAENTDNPDRLRCIVESLVLLSHSYDIVLPLHPRTKKTLDSLGLLSKIDGHVKLIPPLGYLDMVMLEANCHVIVTDSGGVQKEAYFFTKPCVTLRDESEWVELLDAKVNFLCPPTDPNVLTETVTKASQMDIDYPVGLYGAGDAGKKIVEKLFNI